MQNQNRNHSGSPEVGHKFATGLGIFSIALGLVEVFATRTLTRVLRMKGCEDIVRLYGIREIINGIGILRAEDPTPWVRARVAGDALDLATIAMGSRNDHLSKKGSKGSLKTFGGAVQKMFTGRKNWDDQIFGKTDNVSGAFVAVATVTALDIACVRQLNKAPKKSIRDYSDRSGFPRTPQAMRGIARDFEVPRDMRVPEQMQAYEAGYFEQT